MCVSRAGITTMRLAHHPNPLRRRSAERHCAGWRSQAKRLVVAARQHLYARAGPNTSAIEKFHQRAVAFVNAIHQVTSPRFYLRQKLQPAAATTAGILRRHQISMWAFAAAAQLAR